MEGTTINPWLIVVCIIWIIVLIGIGIRVTINTVNGQKRAKRLKEELDQLNLITLKMDQAAQTRRVNTKIFHKTCKKEKLALMYGSYDDGLVPHGYRTHAEMQHTFMQSTRRDSAREVLNAMGRLDTKIKKEKTRERDLPTECKSIW